MVIRRVMGIDPGFGRVGIGIIEGERDRWKPIHYDCITTNAKSSFADRLQEIHDALLTAIDSFHPTDAAVEELFFYKNVTTAMRVAQARGVIMLTLSQAGLPVFEYTPLQVKQAMVGYGRAEKHQVQFMVAKLLGIHEQKNMQDDAADALAVALTCGVTLSGKSSSGVHRK